MLPTGATGEMKTTIFGQTGHAFVNYEGDVRFQVRGQKAFTAKVADLYPNGAKRNIGSFYQNICEGRFDNPTVRRAVDGCLTCILGREAGFAPLPPHHGANPEGEQAARNQYHRSESVTPIGDAIMIRQHLLMTVSLPLMYLSLAGQLPARDLWRAPRAPTSPPQVPRQSAACPS